jgi:hypothetical protein
MTSKLYDRDYLAWIKKTTQQLRDRDFAELDVENLIEEIESLGRKEKRELSNRLVVLLEHLLKFRYWELERDRNARGWQGTIKEQQRQINLILKDSPSLKPQLDRILAEAYRDALDITAAKTGLDLLPEENPFSSEEIFN